MNVRRLRRIKKHILDEPLRVNMDILVRDKEYGDNLPFYHRKKWPECGTVACISGWEMCLYGSPENDGIFQSAARLEVPNHRLFHTRSWPLELQKKIDGLKSGTVKYAKVVAEAIESYIASNGWEGIQ